jgi:hypothetical protein
MKFTDLLRPILTPTGLTGGGANLDGILTVDLTVGVRALVVAGTNASLYHLRAGTDAESSPAIIRPDDYAGTTNEKVWEKLTVI